MIELYSFPTSTCSLKVRICLAEKGLEYKEHRLSPGENGHLTEAYLRMNPNGVVPTLVHDGTVVIDSSVILEYLDEVFPEPFFSPGLTGRQGQNARMAPLLRGKADARRPLPDIPEIPYPQLHQALAGTVRKGGGTPAAQDRLLQAGWARTGSPRPRSPRPLTTCA